jgi:hypothetical protein
MDEQTNGYVSADRLREALREKDIEVDGFRWRIRRIDPAEMLELGGPLDLGVYLPRSKRRRERQVDEDSAEQEYTFLCRVVARGVVSVQIAEPGQPAAEDAIHVEELPADMVGRLFAAIMAHSEHSLREATRVRPS